MTEARKLSDIYIKKNSHHSIALLFTNATSKHSVTNLCCSTSKIGPTASRQANGCTVFQNQLSFLMRCPQREGKKKKDWLVMQRILVVPHTLVLFTRSPTASLVSVLLYWAIQAGLLTPLTFARHRLNPLAAFTSGAYFLHNGRR